MIRVGPNTGHVNKHYREPVVLLTHIYVSSPLNLELRILSEEIRNHTGYGGSAL